MLTFSVAASLILVPDTAAHNPPYQITSYAKVSMQPEVIGVGQSIMGYAFLGNGPLSGSLMTNGIRFHNYTVWITDPEGKVTEYHWDTVEDTTGVQMFRYTPTIVGQYNVTFTFAACSNSNEVTSPTSQSIGDICYEHSNMHLLCTRRHCQLPR